MKRTLYGTIIGLVVAFNANVALTADAVDDAAVVNDAAVTELLPFFTENDDEAYTKQAKVYLTIVKDYEKYLIAKYAPLNLTNEEFGKLAREDPFSAEARERTKFLVIWGQTLRSSRGGRRSGSGLGTAPDTEEMRTYDRLFSKKADTTALSAEQRDFLNGLIISKRITPEGPGVLYNSSQPLAGEDKAFVEEAVKDNPDIKLPWHDPEWQEEALMYQAEGRFLRL